MSKKTNKGGIIIYQPKRGDVKLRIILEAETVWLDARQMAQIFKVNRPAIVKHINNIYKTGELEKKSTCSKTEQVAADGKTRKINLYNLDMIIAVGYRINSRQATRFRIWATKVLKRYLIQGYAVNRQRLLKAEEKFRQLQETITFLQTKSRSRLLQGQEKEILDLLSDYSKTLTLLHQYDNNKLQQSKKGYSKFVLQYNLCLNVIAELKKKLVSKKEAGSLFGNEVDCKFKGIVGNLYQTFNKKELYPSMEEKAANFLYLAIKDHPFSDGNKRIASFLFVYFLDRNNYLYRESGEKKINNNALTALALLIAESRPKEKSQMIALTSQLLK